MVNVKDIYEQSDEGLLKEFLSLSCAKVEEGHCKKMEWNSMCKAQHGKVMVCLENSKKQMRLK